MVQKLIFVGIGDSNMEGVASTTGVPTFNYINRVHFFRPNGTWQNPPVQPLERDPNLALPNITGIGAPGIGPLIAAADRLAELLPNEEVGIVQCAVRGYGLNSWLYDMRTTSLFGSCAKRIHEALAADAGNRFGGYFMTNGAAEANTTAFWTYSPLFTSLVEDLRAKVSDGPIIYAQLGEEPNTEPFNSWGGMQVMQTKMAIPNSAMVSMIGLPSLPPHLTTGGYMTLGRLMADAMLPFLP